MADRPPKLGLPCPDETLLGPLDGRPAADAWPQPCTVESGCTDSVDVSGVLSLGIRLVVWDFDLTLLSIHSFALRLTAADVAVRNLQSDFYALDFYVSLVRRLVDAGVGVAIASFGRGEVIRAYMDRVFIVGADSVQNIFVGSNICTPATIGGVDGWAQPRGKNALLEHLISDPFRGLQKTEVIFFDDDPANVDLAKEAGFPWAVHAPKGFNGALWQSTVGILQSCGSTGLPLAEAADAGAETEESAAAAAARSRAREAHNSVMREPGCSSSRSDDDLGCRAASDGSFMSLPPPPL